MCRSTACWSALALALALSFLSAPAHASDPPELDAPKPTIFGGENSQTCAWPTSISLNGCTGTLVHPEVVIYAAHCGANIPQVILGENNDSQAARVINTEYCRTNPAYNGGGNGTDHAFCKLSEPVYDVPITPILMGCETSVLTPGREVVVVGYGEADIAPSFGTKSEVYTTLNGVSNNQASIGGGGEDACFGDSGGPAFVRLSEDEGGDGTWRVFGIVSYGAPDCTGPSFYSLMHIGMPWFEEQLESEGIDLTPCHDAQGNWVPTPLCQSFPLDPGTPHGDWANGCSEGAPLGGISAICGEGFQPELDPPTVSLTSPPDGSQYDTLGEATVPETFTAEAMDLGSGIEHVRIQVDGADIPMGTDSVAPYEWDLALPPGGYVFTAVARDWSGNESISAPVHIGINQAPPEAEPEPEPDPGETSGGEGSDSGGSEGNAEGSEDNSETGGGGGGIDGDEGCNCNAQPVPAQGGLASLGLLALLALRRRRS